MLDVILSWFGRVWITLAILGMLAFYFFGLPSDLTEDWALFHVGWVPMFSAPNPINILWWVTTVIVALPGIGALILRDTLRRRKQQKVSG